MWRGVGEEWMHVYLWLSPFGVHVKLSQHLIGYTPMEIKSLKKLKYSKVKKRLKLSKGIKTNTKLRINKY